MLPPELRDLPVAGLRVRGFYDASVRAWRISMVRVG